MPAKEDELIREVAALGADLRNMVTNMADLKGFLISNARANTEIITSLAVVKNNQEDMKKYQVECDKDRSDHEKRITACEGFQGRQLRIVVAVAGVIGFLVQGGTKLLDKVFGS